MQDERLLLARVELLYESSPAANLFLAAVVALMAGVFWTSEPRPVIALWAAVMIVVCAARYLLVLYHRRRRGRPAPLKALRRHVAGVVLAGCGWAAASLLLFAGSTVWHQYLLSLVIAGVAAAGVTIHSPSRVAVTAFLGLTLIPLAVVNVVAGEELGIILAAMIGLYLLVLLRLSNMQYQALLKSLRLRYEHEELVEEMRRARIAAEKINTKLKAEIATRSQTEAELIDARDKAEQGARAKSDFLATMSHEIRTPMNGVLGMTELLLDTELSAKQHRFADTIRRSGEALLAIINDILDFSKIEAGKLEIQHTVFDLRQLCEDTVAFFAAQAQRKGLDIMCVFPAEEHAAYRGDPERIRQVLTNLIGNAVKFTERGQVVLSVTTVDHTEDSVIVRCQVLDTGIGIQPDHMEHIFDAFSQADASTTRNYGGTGLGLSICARLVGLMGGEIGVGSTVGKGSKFWFTVSLTEMPETAVAAGNIRNSDQLEGLKALIIDDNETNREVLGHQLDAWKVSYDGIACGRQAVPILESASKSRRPYDLVIVDRQMPEMDGMEVARAVKQEKSLAQTPVIMLSSINQLETTSQWFQAGVDYYVNKPVRQAELYDALCTVTGRDSTAGDLAGTQGTAGEAFSAHVLLAEDNEVNQELARTVLGGLGCTVEVVSNGRDAVEAVTGCPLDTMQKGYDIILMDCQMPELDGYDATREIRAWEAEQAGGGETAQRLPIIALTANALHGDQEVCEAAGMDDYQTKPFSTEDLRVLLSRWLTIDKAAPAATTEVPAVKEKDAKAPAAMLDPDRLAAIRSLQGDFGEDLLSRIIQIFLQSSPKLLEKMQEAAATGNASQLSSAAHSLKSSAANLGATDLAALCRDLEQLGREEDMGDVLATLGTLEYEFEAVCEALNDTLGSVQPA